MDGAAYHFDIANDAPGSLGPGQGDDNLNSLDMGGNVHERPTALRVSITPLEFVDLTGAAPVRRTYAGDTDLVVPPSATTLYWLAADATLNTGSAFPDPREEAFIPLAEVIASATEVTAVNDKRPRVTLAPRSPVLTSRTVAELGTLAAPVVGELAFATDGRKVGEGAGAGTGVPAYYDGTSWLRTSDDTVVAA